MESSASEIAQRLSREAEAVCRHYLSNGRKQGGYWLVGDTGNTPGRSLYVRLTGPTSGKGAAGKWTDAATGEHGDLLDLIAAHLNLSALSDTLEEARRFLSLPRPERPPPKPQAKAPTGSPWAARRLWAISRPISGTLAETYLHGRGITALRDTASLRFHSHCYYRPDRHGPTETWPAWIAAVTDLDGIITGVHRTWLDPDGFTDAALGKAPIDTPRRALGKLLGHAVRFGTPHDVMAAGEGIETVLSLKQVLPTLPMAAALSAAHLAALRFPPTLRRLYIARDHDPAGDDAVDRLIDRATEIEIEAIPLSPLREDFNEDLHHLGSTALRQHLRPQIAPDDVDRFLEVSISYERSTASG